MIAEALRRLRWIVLLPALVAACTTEPQLEDQDDSTEGSGGSTGSGGRRGSGGSSSSGGSTSSGGSSSGSTGGSSGTTGSGKGGSTAKGGGSGAAGGSTGSGGSSSQPDASARADAGGAAPSRGPTPASGGTQFPFPQNRESSRCIYPASYRNEDVKSVYQKWYADMVTSDGAKGHLRVQRPREPGLDVNSTVSEGIGYGMLIAVFMGDKTLFDDLWAYEKEFRDACGLMNWYIKADGSGPGLLDGTPSTGAAFDADEDMAYALVMAHEQWGTQSYLDDAKSQLDAMWNCEVLDGKLPQPGDGSDGKNRYGGWKMLNISYFAPSYYRTFAKVDSSHAWSGASEGGTDNVVKTVYDTIKNNLNSKLGNQTNGLVPAWSDSDGNLVSGMADNYQYDACRTPFRVGIDWCMNGETLAKDYVAKTSAFFSGVGVRSIEDGYNLDGSVKKEYSSAPDKQSAAFIGPAAVGAMSVSTYQKFVDDAYELLVSGTDDNLTCGGLYYDESWRMMALLMLTGNFLDYTQY